MTVDEIETIELDDSERPDDRTFDAECLNCGIKTRFTTCGEPTLGDEFRHRCVSCGSGRWPLLGNVQWFRVTSINPETEYPNGQTDPVNVFQSSTLDKR